MTDERCQHVKDDGERCRVDWDLSDDGLCIHHDPERREAMQENRRKGGLATARKLKGKGLDPAELPALESHRAAETWCDVVGRAVAEGRLGHNEGRTILRAVREWRESHDAGEVTEQIEEMREALSEWKATGSPDRILALVD